MPAVFPSNDSSILTYPPLRAWALSDHPPPAHLSGQAVYVSEGWLHLIDSIRFMKLQPPAGLGYMGWQLLSRNNFRDALRRISGVDRALFPFLDNVINQDINAQEVLAVRSIAYPFGEILARIIDRPARATSLVIAFFGHRNKNPCDHCCRRFAKYECHTNDEPGDHDIVPVNWPFFECLSHPNLASGKCANCIFHVESDCDYNLNSVNRVYHCVGRNAAKADGSPGLPPRPLSNWVVERVYKRSDELEEVKEANRAQLNR